MDENKDCMLVEITRFLIRVGEHCMECEGKTMLKEPTITKKPITRIDTPMKIIDISSSSKKQTSPVHNIKKSYLKKWIQNNNFKEFTLEQFFEAYPKQKENNRLNSNIYKLIKEGILLQVGKNNFKVVRRNERC